MSEARSPQDGTRDLRPYWYPVAFAGDVPSSRPTKLRLLDEALVLYRDGAGAPQCVLDRCPHRSTPLSLGRVVEGRLECRYHGWQFGTGGRCEHVPTLALDDTIPQAASAFARPAVEKQGIVWVWMGAVDMADPAAIPIHPEIGSKDWKSVDMTHEFDIDHTLMIENLLDPSHLPFTHENTLAKRSDAQPLELGLEICDDGFVGSARKTRSPSAPPQRFTFQAPCTVRLDLTGPRGSGFVQIHHCLPLELKSPRMRMLSRMVRNWMTRAPGVGLLTRLGSWRILTQDTAMLIGQQKRLAEGAPAWQCPVGADRMAIEYRRWRGRAGGAVD